MLEKNVVNFHFNTLLMALITKKLFVICRFCLPVIEVLVTEPLLDDSLSLKIIGH